MDDVAGIAGKRDARSHQAVRREPPQRIAARRRHQLQLAQLVARSAGDFTAQRFVIRREMRAASSAGSDQTIETCSPGSGSSASTAPRWNHW